MSEESSEDDAYIVNQISINLDSEYFDVANFLTHDKHADGKRDTKWISDNAATRHMSF